jgi:hypothetical protein
MNRTDTEMMWCGGVCVRARQCLCISVCMYVRAHVGREGGETEKREKIKKKNVNKENEKDRTFEEKGGGVV